ncbi:hypothetical protein [Parvularcula sp. LCG005]|uniref:hypothetical protein n=1 Tax=Parvularcula sp. LCG005 TaxID=3078805 RepID=UPI00397CDF9F
MYEAPSTYDGAVAISDQDRAVASLRIPNDASGKDLHIILELKDDGAPSLTTYRRAILKVK